MSAFMFCERFIYSHDRSTYFPVLRLRTDRGNLNCSQIHKCSNWERGRAVSFLGIFVSSFRYSAFAVYGTAVCPEEANCTLTHTQLHTLIPISLQLPSADKHTEKENDNSGETVKNDWLSPHYLYSLCHPIEWVKFPGKTKKGGVIIPDDNITW